MKENFDETYDFLVIGSSVIDIHARTMDMKMVDIRKAAKLEQLVCVSFASKTELDSLDVAVGGSAMNSATTIAHLGSRVALVSAIGNDMFGRKLLDELDDENISKDFIKIKKGKTGVGINLLSGEDGEKSILVYRGVINELAPRDLPERVVARSNYLFVTSLVSESSYALFMKAVQLARKHRKPIIFAPSISMLNAFGERINKIQRHFDMVVVNFEEGKFYTGKNSIEGILLALPGKINVLMKDAEGAYAREGRKIYHINAVPVHIRGTVGAGDAFSGAFASEYFRTRSVKEALKVAASIAAMKLEHVSAVFHPTLNQIKAFMTKHTGKLRIFESVESEVKKNAE